MLSIPLQMHVPHITGNINMLLQYLKYALQSAIKVTELYIGKELSIYLSLSYLRCHAVKVK
jgi:hypothetical protein